MLREYNFEIEEFKDGKDTEADRKPSPNNFDAYFADLGKNVREQRKKLSEGQKIGCIFHYSGHGYIVENQTHIFLPDETDDLDKYYNLELKIRQFNELHPYVYVLSVFDCCRSLPSDQPRTKGGNLTDGKCNYTNIYAAEKEKLAEVRNFMTRQLVAQLKN